MTDSAKEHTRSKPDPVRWDEIEPHYKAGLRSVASIGRQFGVSHVAILKHAKKMDWVRSLKPQILARADELVTAAQVTGSVTAKAPSVTERIAVESHAQAIALLQIAHQASGAELRGIATELLAELRSTTRDADLFVRLRDLLETLEDEPSDEQRLQMRKAFELIASLPGRAKVLRDVVDSFHKIIGLEREAFGLNTDSGTGGLITVIIRDYTGRGAPEAPMPMAERLG